MSPRAKRLRTKKVLSYCNPSTCNSSLFAQKVPADGLYVGTLYLAPDTFQPQWYKKFVVPNRPEFQFNLLSTDKTTCSRKQQQMPVCGCGWCRVEGANLPPADSSCVGVSRSQGLL